MDISKERNHAPPTPRLRPLELSEAECGPMQAE